jgi:hypothetical protein
MKTTDLAELVSLQGRCGYAATNKARFRALAMKMLKELRQLTDTQADVRFNPGGIAVSGDATLHGDRFYVSFNADGISSGLGIMYRTCNGKRDYTGGRNCWWSWDRLLNDGVAGLAAAIGSELVYGHPPIPFEHRVISR